MIIFFLVVAGVAAAAPLGFLLFALTRGALGNPERLGKASPRHVRHSMRRGTWGWILGILLTVVLLAIAEALVAGVGRFLRDLQAPFGTGPGFRGGSVSFEMWSAILIGAVLGLMAGRRRALYRVPVTRDIGWSDLLLDR